jgi:2-polyprenyl-3-methyl-5-hydroxy-6-metoxy-1,4-benzoquinol methylase
MSDAYTSFAQVYDLFMDDVPYDLWCEYICGVLRENGIEDGPVLDLGCGTGALTRRLAKAGYDMTGADASPDMLQEAMMLSGEESEILYLLQPMQELDLDGSVRAVISACDCINYVLNPEELMEAFRRIYAALEPGGVFIFDINTDWKYTNLLGENTFAESRDEGAFIWENYYDEESGINEYDLTLFIPDSDGRFIRQTETHFEKSYAILELEEMLKNTGFTVEGIYDDYTKNPLRDDSERATFIAKKIRV